MSNKDRQTKSSQVRKVSKAPAPITPLRGINTASVQPMSTVPADWGFWSQRIESRLWEAIALSLNLDPRHGSLGSKRERDEVLYGEGSPSQRNLAVMRDRLAIAVDHLRKTLKPSKLTYLDDLNQQSVRLSDFAAWAAYMKWQPFPAPFARMANFQSVNDLAVRLTVLNTPDRERDSRSEDTAASNFSALTPILEPWFGKPLADLPDGVRQRIKRDLSMVPWDNVNVDQRRYATVQWDYQHDPAMEAERQRSWDFYARMNELEQQIEQWEQVAATTATDLEKKETRLTDLRQQRSLMQAQEHRTLKGSPELPPRSSTSSEIQGDHKYIPYLKALRYLSERLGAIPEELAAWVWMGPRDGGIAAYLNANELNPPPRFYYDGFSGQNHDYVEPLMACWFQVDDVLAFDPIDRFITGASLIERWGKHPGIRPAAYIRAKIRESRLLDAHPIFGATQGSFPQRNSYPPIEDGLFLRSHIEEIEALDFRSDPTGDSVNTTDAKEPPVGSPEWRIKNARAAANARHSQPGGSREKQQQLRDLWASGKYESRDRCAEEECAALGMSFAAARRALKNTPDPQPS